ncbi:MAG: S-layer homology domain-containing protein [Ginsengibacter sp.]
MKHYSKLFSSLIIFSLLMGNVEAQTRTKIKTASKRSSKTIAPKFIEPAFGSPSSVIDITDVADSNKSYNSVKSLLDQHVTLTYADNTFKGNEPLRRGDFIVALNSALDAVKNVGAQNGLDSSGVSGMSSGTMSGDNNSTTVTASSTSVNSMQYTDLKEGSVYYPAIQSLTEKGVTMPYTDAKNFNPGATVSEKEVYDVLNQVFNYDKSGMNPYTTSISRNKFAMVLNNAVSVKLQEQYTMMDQKNAQAEQLRQQEKARMDSELLQQDQMRKDSLNKAYQAEQLEIEAKAVEAQSKKKHRNKK